MNRHSIFFKLNILFVVAIVATVIAGASIMLHLMKKDGMDMMFKSRLIMQEYRVTKSKPVALFKEFGLSEIIGEEKAFILENAHKAKQRFQRKFTSTLLYEGKKYLHIHKPRYNLLLQDKRTFMQRFMLSVLVFFSIVTLLILMYILLRKSLTPLKKLQQDIVKYGEGELQNYTFSEKKDEISQASNAFYNSVNKVNRLTKSRQLFIRNLFHELNTPVTKGKILTEIVEDKKTKTMLDSIFSRLSSLLKELAQMEKITSQSYTLVKKPLRIIDLIDEAHDLLYMEDDIKHNVKNEMIKADFSTMSIVFKNLIDNAVKYGTDLEIVYEKNRLSFVSKGDVLKEELAYYTEAFSKGEELNNRGFGLGLYIVNEILQKHEMGFEYYYSNVKNHFTVLLENYL